MILRQLLHMDPAIAISYMRFEVDNMQLEVLHLPGHTAEHIVGKTAANL